MDPVDDDDEEEDDVEIMYSEARYVRKSELAISDSIVVCFVNFTILLIYGILYIFLAGPPPPKSLSRFAVNLASTNYRAQNTKTF